MGKQLPEASARVGKGAVEALKGAAADENIGNPVKDALNSLGKVRCLAHALGVLPVERCGSLGKRVCLLVSVLVTA